MSYIDFLSQRVHISSCLSSHLFMQRNKSCDQNRGNKLESCDKSWYKCKTWERKVWNCQVQLQIKNLLLFFQLCYAGDQPRPRWLLKIVNIWGYFEILLAKWRELVRCRMCSELLQRLWAGRYRMVSPFLMSNRNKIIFCQEISMCFWLIWSRFSSYLFYLF